MGICGGVSDKAEKEVYISAHLEAWWESSLWEWEQKKAEKRWRERIDSDSYADNLMLINLSSCIINSIKYLWINNEQDDKGVFAFLAQLRKTQHIYLFMRFVWYT